MITEDQEYNEFIAEATQKVVEVNDRFNKLSDYNKQRAVQYFFGSAVSLSVLEKIITQLNLNSRNMI